MSPRTKRWILAVGCLLMVALVALGVVLVRPTDPLPAPAAAGSSAAPAPLPAADVADRFLAALARGATDSAGALTDDPAGAARQLAAVWRGLAPASVTAKRSGPVAPVGSTARAPFSISWTFGPQRVWGYDSTLPLAEVGLRDWRVHWTPALVHPKLTADRGLAVKAGETGQPAVLDRDGAPLLVWQQGGAGPVDPGVAPLLIGPMTRVAGTGGGGAGGWQVVLVDAAGAELETVGGNAGGEASRPVTATLSVPIQRAAQAAVESAALPARLVAIQPSTGDILAVAQNTAAGAEPQALNGLYPPGSMFKIATAVAALEAGAATIDTVLPCPGTAAIGPRTIPNDNRFELGDVPLRTAFARSCNTTFARLAADLPDDALSNAATQLGLNADFVVPGITTEAGSVKPAGSVAQRVENGIGQGTVQASPFGVALMTATVASGRALTPRLWRDVETTVSAGYRAPPRAVLDGVRTMMRAVVTGGTARALAGRGAVFGKTGTAQVGDGSTTHGWFTGYRGDLAFAVLVEGAESSGAAVTVSGAFLDAAR
ncbi:MAG TPA: penicillin-binding transpeptidase domain-containing protein [Actinophytocola sp.]|uniref:penicillin-binding transpeptidase domain-containing protein n=1 Tax=Actinophytocola sp. TaxID=1872138 RepID=UPI002DDCE7C1|nr:penicillin-binding transpeptidase domain-containing protein [Actinophytocola sp.]HEV2784644.1 penicillin-binding transpeptidase domain-containing protein [Actinophytocola sp.]